MRKEVNDEITLAAVSCVQRMEPVRLKKLFELSSTSACEHSRFCNNTGKKLIMSFS